MKLAIVIVNYNTSNDLDRCLESISAYPPAAEFQVVIVDNASSDEGLGEVHRRYPDFLWIFSRENSGYARGCNLGMAEVEADYYLVLNPDIVVQPGALDRLIEFADKHPRAGLIGPQLLNPDGTIQDTCRRFYTFRTLLLRRTFLGKIFPNSETVRRHLMADFDHRSVRPVDWVLGGCLLVRRSAMDRTGPMDERFFLYFEDVDWCYRMWQAGNEVLYTPDARFTHRHRRASAKGTFSKTFWMHLGSLISFYEKWGMLVWLVKKWRQPLVVFLLWLLDLVGLGAAFGAAYGLRKLAVGFFSEDLYPFAEYRPVLLFSVLLMSLTFLLTGRYAGRALQTPSVPAHLQRIGIIGVMLLASTYLGHLEVVSRAVLLAFIPLLAAATWTGEALLRRLLRRLQREHLSLERTLLVGHPERISAWLAGAGDLAVQGIDVAGYIADPRDAQGGLPAIGGGEIPWLGPRRELTAVAGRYRISQVVFWDPPGDQSGAYRLLAGLRRMRVRLRWHVPDAWLLATGAEPEVFGGELGGVQQTGGALAVRVMADRLLGLVVGVMLAVGGLLPALWLTAVLVRRGRAQQRTIRLDDIWGHDPRLQLTVDADGRVMSLPWQWKLAAPLLTGKLAVYGPRPDTGRLDAAPHTAAEVAAFWKGQPLAPGLTGPWADDQSNPPGVGTLWRQLWRDPGGFGYLTHQDASESAPDEHTVS